MKKVNLKEAKFYELERKSIFKINKGTIKVLLKVEKHSHFSSRSEN